LGTIDYEEYFRKSLFHSSVSFGDEIELLISRSKEPRKVSGSDALALFVVAARNEEHDFSSYEDFEGWHKTNRKMALWGWHYHRFDGYRDDYQY